MNKQHWLTTLLLMSSLNLNLQIESVFARDNPTIRSGIPCIEEICLGDNILKLGKIKWQPVRQLTPSELDMLAKEPDPYRGNVMVGNSIAIKSMFPYLISRSIDRQGIKILSGIKGFCNIDPRLETSPIFSGEYIGRTGLPVIVGFVILISPDKKTQRIVVGGIFKQIFDRQDGRPSVAVVEDEIKRSYPGIGYSAFQRHPSGFSASYIAGANIGYTNTLLLTGGAAAHPGYYLPYPNRTQDLMSLNACNKLRSR
jgi:hypothetical protein